VLSSSESKAIVVLASNWRNGILLGGAGVPWYGDIAFTLPTAAPHKTMVPDHFAEFQFAKAQIGGSSARLGRIKC